MPPTHGAGVENPSKKSVGTGSVQSEGDTAVSNANLEGPTKPDSSRARFSATDGVDSITSLGPQLVASSKEDRPISEGLAQTPTVAGGDAGPGVSDGEIVKNKTFGLKESVPLPVITSEPIRVCNEETIPVVEYPRGIPFARNAPVDLTEDDQDDLSDFDIFSEESI